MYPRACGLLSKYGHSDIKQCHILVHEFLSARLCQLPLVLEQTCLANEVWQDQGQGKIVVLESKAEQNYQGNVLWAVTWYYSMQIWTNSAWKKSSKSVSLKVADLLFMLNWTQCYKSVEVTEDMTNCPVYMGQQRTSWWEIILVWAVSLQKLETLIPLPYFNIEETCLQGKSMYSYIHYSMFNFATSFFLLAKSKGFFRTFSFWLKVINLTWWDI